MSDEPNKPQQPEEPAQPTIPDAQPAPEPAVDSTTAQIPNPAAGEPVADAATAADAPPPPPPPPPAQPVQPVVARQPGGFGRFVGHRATQIVAAGIAGLLIGGGAVALIGHDGDGNGDRHAVVYQGGGPKGGGQGREYLPPRGGERGFPGGGGPRMLPPQRPAPAPPTNPAPPTTTSPPPSSATPG